MDINYVHEFVVLADSNSFTEAAEKLFIAQSALSKHIKSMEDELDVKLIDRSYKHIRLTQAGEMFLLSARKISVLREDYLRNLDNLKNHTLSIAPRPVSPSYGMTPLIASFLQEHPEVRLTEPHGEESDAQELILNHKCDVAVVYDDEIFADSLKKLDITKDELCVIVPKNHPLAKYDSVFAEQLMDEKFVFPKSSSNLYRLCMKICSKAGFNPDVVVHMSNSNGMIKMVSFGKGITFFPLKSAKAFLNTDNIKIIMLKPTVAVNTCLLYENGSENSIPGEFVKFVQKYLKSHGVSDEA